MAALAKPSACVVRRIRVIVPRVRPMTRALSVAVCVGQIYLAYGMELAFPWYYPPVTLLTICVLSLIFDQGLSFFDAPLERHPWAPYARAGVAVAAIALVCATFAASLGAAVQLKILHATIQRNLTEIGLYLKEQASSPHDTVFLEPLGYIGFYSNLKSMIIRDYRLMKRCGRASFYRQLRWAIELRSHH